jgi:hypothetical protein
MKTIVKIIICATLLTLPCFGFAQSGYTGATDLDVNGIFIGGTYTKAQVTAKWGTPTKYRSNTSEFGVNETYNYSSNRFGFSDNGIFGDFFIDTTNFIVYKSKGGGFKVGDHVSRLKTIGVIPNSTIIKTGSGENVLQIQHGDDWFKVGYSNGIITWISFDSPI